ncbi:MAG: ABC transporter permease [Acidimicrobiia bacterium]
MRTALLKLGRLLFVLIVVTFLSFWMLKLQEQKSDLVTILAPNATKTEQARLRADIGLTDPFFTQYWHWVSNFVQGDFGKTYTGAGAHVTGVPVSDGLWKRLPVSLELMLYAQVLALVIAIPMGVFTAYKNGTLFDRISNVTAFAMLAMPPFLAALLLVVYIAANHVGNFPTQYTGVGNFPLNPLDSENIRQLLLPTISLAIGQIAVYMRLLRSDMIATLQEDFITTAKAKGIPARRVLFRHALRPSSLTLLTVAGLNVGALIGGAIVVERIFNLPGVGGRLAEAILSHQLIETQAIVAVIAVIYVLVNFLVDILYTVLDPRIRHARAIA